MFRRIALIASIGLVVGSGYFLWTARSNRPAQLQASSAAENQTNSSAISSGKSAQPRAVVDREPHDLGVMNPGDVRKHRFRVRNEGTADLTLELGSTSCKCTLAAFDRMRIPPGGIDFIELEWHAENPQFRFRQGATVNTNDPALPQFELMGEGSIRVKLAAQPNAIYLADVPRNKLRTMNVLLYSQDFKEVQIEKIESTLTAVSAVVATEVPTVQPVQESRFLRDLVVTLQPQAKSGHEDGTLRISYSGLTENAKQEKGVLEIPLSYDVIGDVTLHGRDVVGKTLIFGPVSQSAGAKKQAYVHVRGENLDDLRLTPKRSNPEFLKVDVGAVERLAPTIARFPVTVEVPADSPVATYADEDLAEVELTTSRADTPSIRFQVSLVIAP